MDFFPSLICCTHTCVGDERSLQTYSVFQFRRKRLLHGTEVNELKNYSLS